MGNLCGSRLIKATATEPLMIFGQDQTGTNFPGLHLIFRAYRPRLPNGMALVFQAMHFS
jgi:hypothetical protein